MRGHHEIDAERARASRAARVPALVRELARERDARKQAEAERDELRREVERLRAGQQGVKAPRGV